MFGFSFQNVVYTSFSTGSLLREMNITEEYVIARFYLDAFGVNCAIGSASSKHKVLGVYVSIFNDLKICANRSTIQTAALLFDKVQCAHFGVYESQNLSLIYLYICIRVRPRCFDQVGHETMYASSGNKHFFIKSCHRQTYQNYEQQLVESL